MFAWTASTGRVALSRGVGEVLPSIPTAASAKRTTLSRTDTTAMLPTVALGVSSATATHRWESVRRKNRKLARNLRSKTMTTSLLYPNVIWRVRLNVLHAVRNRYALGMGCGALCGDDMIKDRAPTREERRALRVCLECARMTQVQRGQSRCDEGVQPVLPKSRTRP